MAAEPGKITITIIGPEDVPDLHVPERIADDGTVVPALTVDMSNAFHLRAEVRCRCGQLYGWKVLGHREVINGWPEMVQRYRDELCAQVKRAVDACPHTPEWNRCPRCGAMPHLGPPDAYVGGEVPVPDDGTVFTCGRWTHNRYELTEYQKRAGKTKGMVRHDFCQKHAHLAEQEA